MRDKHNPIHRHVTAVNLILTAAKANGLPHPTAITVGCFDITVHFQTVGDLAEWAAWGEATVTERTTENGVHHTAHAVLLDQPVKLGTFTSAVCRCGHQKSSHTVFGSGCSASTRGYGCSCALFQPAATEVVPA